MTQEGFNVKILKDGNIDSFEVLLREMEKLGQEIFLVNRDLVKHVYDRFDLWLVDRLPIPFQHNLFDDVLDKLGFQVFVYDKHLLQLQEHQGIVIFSAGMG